MLTQRDFLGQQRLGVAQLFPIRCVWSQRVRPASLKGDVRELHRQREHTIHLPVYEPKVKPRCLVATFLLGSIVLLLMVDDGIVVKWQMVEAGRSPTQAD